MQEISIKHLKLVYNTSVKNFCILKNRFLLIRIKSSKVILVDNFVSIKDFHPETTVEDFSLVEEQNFFFPIINLTHFFRPIVAIN